MRPMQLDRVEVEASGSPSRLPKCVPHSRKRVPVQRQSDIELMTVSPSRLKRLAISTGKRTIACSRCDFAMMR